MTLADLIAGSLATWALTYLTTFSWLAQRLRDRLSILEEEDGGQFDRNAYTLAGAWVNCASCMALVFGVAVGLWMCFLPRWPVYCLALAGGGNLLARWWMSQRVKARWWD